MSKSTKILVSPGRYVQGREAISQIGKHVALFGKNALVIGGARGLEATRAGRTESFEKYGVNQVEELFNGECSFAEIDRIAALAQEKGCDIIIGSGGGKVLDTAKAAAHKAKLPAAIVPTVASSDAPCSALAVVYTPEHTVEKFLFLPKNPDLVLVDTRIIAQSPARMLVAGMGDALATWFEAEACTGSGSRNTVGGQSTAAALNLAGLCFDLLMEYGPQAKVANEQHVVTPALEKVVEANILLSGIGFESAGIAAAHSLQDTLNVLKECHDYYHGEKIAFLTLVQLVLEGRSYEDLEDIFEFNYMVGLPVCLEDLNLEGISGEALMKAVESSKVINHSFPVTSSMVYDAFLAVDAMGRRLKQGLPIA